MIEARNLSKSYRNQKVLNELSFTLEKGHVLGILGPNGAGKTTLIRILALIIGADSGKLFYNGKDASQNAAELRPLIGYVPQDIALFEDLSVWDNLLCWSRQGDVGAKAQARRLIDELNLGDFWKKKISALSGGMKRRVNLAVAMLDDPEVLILDEPLVGVDIEQRRQITQYLKGCAERGVTQIITSHHVDELISFADEIMIMKNGDNRFYGQSKQFAAMREKNNPGGTLDELVLTMLKNEERGNQLL